MSRFAAHLAAHMLAAAAPILPSRLSPWAAAMRRELAEIEGGVPAVLFAAGCVRAILGLAIAAHVSSLLAATHRLAATMPSTWSMTMNRISARPRLLGLLCAVGAVAAGMAYMQMAGAPPRYSLVNLAALVLGATLWLALARHSAIRGIGPLIVMLALALLLTALIGIRADGAARWVSFGALSLQVSLVAVPIMLVLYARGADPIGTVGMIIGALALALQPDRAMAGVMLAGLAALVATRPSWLAVSAAAAALISFAFAVIMPDTLPAVPFVDRILYTAFDVHPLAGVAVLAGAAAIIVPALGTLSKGARERPVLLVFGACWLAVVVAAALGNSPTPMVGYGGSAILGYLVSVALLPEGAGKVGRGVSGQAQAAAHDSSDTSMSELRVPRLA